MRISRLLFVSAISVGSLVHAQPTQPAPPTAPAAPKAKVLTVMGGSYIGVMVQEIDSDRAKVLRLREEAGVEITRVDADSPAEKAGLKNGDAILQYNGQRIEGIEQFSRLVRETPVGRDVKLDVVRNGAPQTIVAKLAARRSGNMAFAAPAMAPSAWEFKMPDMPRSFMSWQSSMLGIEGESLEGQLAQFFGVKEGVLVRSVVSGSSADKGGLKAGDVIVRVDDSKVTTPTDVTSRLRSQRGKAVGIVVMRDRKEVTLTVTIEEDRHGELFWQQQLAPNGGFVVASPAKAGVVNLLQN
jgi:serine protease Do